MRTGLVLPSRIGNWATALSVATSMTVAFAPASADTQARVPSGVKATVRGLSPTCSVFSRRPVLASSTDTVLFVSAVTYNFVPSRVTPTPSGSTPTGVEKSVLRSEERRVGKECRSRWGPDDDKKRGADPTTME